MSAAVPIAFYAPLKHPDHPLPSGDRTMARLFLAALRQAGFAPEVASILRSFDGSGEACRQRAIRDQAAAEADRIADNFRRRPAHERPRLWFTYHLYYKAPDWIGPQVCERLDIPYVVAEGSRAGKRAGGAWDLGHRGAETALDGAEAVLAMTEADLEALERARPVGQRLLLCPPFLDLAAWPVAPRRPLDATVGLLTVAMMRRGDKSASYRILAEALSTLGAAPWSLDVVGDGEAAEEVRRLFAFGERVRFHGRIENLRHLAELYAASELFVWPAVNEAYGMAFLEAQASGCAVVAGRYGGVPGVVQDGETGLLTEPGDAGAFAAAVAQLIDDPLRRSQMGAAARRFVTEECDLPQAAALLRATLTPLLRPEILG